MTHRIRVQLGFNLAELAVVLVIVGILLAGALIPLATQLEVKSIADTQRGIEQVKEAIFGFTQSNGRVPCPATPTIATGVTNAGVEQMSGNNCATTYGVVPWVTLGITETDAWGRRYSYWVDNAFGDAIASNTTQGSGQATCSYASLSPAPTQSSFAICSEGGFTIRTRATDHSFTATAQKIPLVIISHGKNGNGAYLPSGTKTTVSGALSDEASNATSTSTTFYSRTATPTASDCDDTTSGKSFCEFDDIVAWITSYSLVTRVISAGKLP